MLGSQNKYKDLLYIILKFIIKKILFSFYWFIKKYIKLFTWENIMAKSDLINVQEEGNVFDGKSD